MIFLVQQDLDDRIDALQQAAAVKGDNTKYTLAEAYALGLIRSHLGGKYNCDAIFSATGANRNPLVLEYCASLAIYNLLKNGLNPRNIPDIRKDDHEQALKWLEKVASDKLNPPGLPLIDALIVSTRAITGGTKSASLRW